MKRKIRLQDNRRFDDPVFPTEDIKFYLAKILRSRGWRKAPMLVRLLDYLVWATLANDTRALSAYAVGVDCLGLAETFDPNSNPHVRVTIGRLRNALDRYYLTEGRGDRLRIEIPKGGTRLAFRNPVIPDARRTEPEGESAARLIDRILQFSTIDPKLREGYYDCLFPSFVRPGQVMVHLMKITARERTYRFKSIFRTADMLGLSPRLSPIKFSGEFLHLNGKYFSIYAEYPNPSMVAFLAMEPADPRFSGTASSHKLLVGVNTALTADRARAPQATPAVLLFMGETVNLRERIGNTGYFPEDSDRVPPLVRPYLSGLRSLTVDLGQIVL